MKLDPIDRFFVVLLSLVCPINGVVSSILNVDPVSGIPNIHTSPLESDSNIVEALDSVLNRYIDDYFFRKELKREMKQIRIRKDEDKLTAIVNWIISVFDSYEVGYTRNIYFSRWI